MRVLQVIHQYAPDYVGGTETYTQSLAGALAERGHAVAVFTRVRRKGEPQRVSKTISSDGIWIYRVYASEPPGIAALFLDSFENPSALAAFEETLFEFKPDVVHIQHLKGLHHAIVARAGERGIPIVLTLHDYWYYCGNAQLIRPRGTTCAGPRLWLNCVDCAAHRAGTRWLWGALPVATALFAHREHLLRRVVKSADCVIAPSEFVRECYSRRFAFGERLRVVPHGIVPLPTPVRAPASLAPAPEAPLRLLFAGGLTAAKGAHILVEAIRTVPAKRVTLDVCGDETSAPEYANELKASAQGLPVRFHGTVDRAQLSTLMAECDVLAVPSLWHETFSLIAAEAQAVGMLVLASDLGALRERVRSAADGWLLPAGDVGAWRDLIGRLAEDPIIVQTRRTCVTRYEMTDHAQQIADEYAHLLRTARAGSP